MTFRTFIEEVLANSAELLLSLSDWLCETFGPVLEELTDALCNFLAILDAYYLTYYVVLGILVVSLLL